jgi:hypothetical protein
MQVFGDIMGLFDKAGTSGGGMNPAATFAMNRGSWFATS